MARMPAAEWLGEHSPKTAMTRYDIVCVHTIVGYAPAHAAHFSTWSNGRIGQSRDTAYRSAANLEGNHRIIAIENADHGDGFPSWSGSDVPPLTDAQVIANGRILAWANGEHGIPLQLAPDSRPDSRGLAYHRQGIDGNFGSFRYPGRVADGEVWTEHFGKVCPGDKRIAQLPDILDAAVTIKRGGSLTNQEDDMPTADEIAKAVWNYQLKRPGKTDDTIRAGVALAQAWNRSAAEGVRKQVAAVKAAVDRNASADEIKKMLESLDATIVLSIKES